MSRNRAKGTAAETAVVRHFTSNGFPYAERRALAGAADKGDLTGIPGLVVECKAATRIELPAWMRETEAERINAGADIGVLVVKPRGVGETRVGDWPAIVPLHVMTRLLRDAGYGTPNPTSEDPAA